ncbi:MAG: hypothetical protein CL910_02445 [Deltaproteobacteria bacterium]|nr:hypothetical protein [Deltaproteobacteria bacterium]
MSTLPPPRCLDDLVACLQKRFDGEAADDLHAVVHFDLTGSRGGSVVLRIEPGKADIGPGTVGEPDLRLRVDARDFFAVLAGTQNVDVLHLEGKLEVEGNLGLAMRLRTLFPAR